MLPIVIVATVGNFQVIWILLFGKFILRFSSASVKGLVKREEGAIFAHILNRHSKERDQRTIYFKSPFKIKFFWFFWGDWGLFWELSGVKFLLFKSEKTKQKMKIKQFIKRKSFEKYHVDKFKKWNLFKDNCEILLVF